MDFQGNSCESSLQIVNDMRWAVFHDGRTLFSNIPFIDYRAIDQQRAFQQMHQMMFQQQMMQQMHQNAV